MCLVCRCTHCKDGDCDGKHHAHDAIRQLRSGKITEKIAVMLAMDDGVTEDAAREYIAAKRDWVKELQDYDWYDRGGGQEGFR